MTGTVVCLSLRGTLFYVSKDTVVKYPDALLGAAAQQNEVMGVQLSTTVKTPDGSKAYFFDRDPEIFRRVILSFYTYGFWQWFPNDSPKLVYDELCFSLLLT